MANFDGEPTLVIAARAGQTRLIDNVPLDTTPNGPDWQAEMDGRQDDSNDAAGAGRVAGEREADCHGHGVRPSSARIAEAAGVDVILVGDSLGMVVQGYDTTVPVTMDEMLHHARPSSRGTAARSSSPTCRS